MRNKVFLSYSSKDSEITERIKQKINTSKIWMDFFEIENGQALIEEIEKGMSKSIGFILILSKNSLKSNWVKTELNMAFIRKMEDYDYRIHCVKIDDCEVPLRLKSYLYKNDTNTSTEAINDILEIVNKISEGYYGKVIRRNFIDRSNDFGRFEDFLSDENIKIICISGMYGIGKSSFIDEIVYRFYSGVTIKKINCTKAHKGLRLCLELCAIAGIDYPEQDDNKIEIQKRIILSIEKIISKSIMLVFDNFDETLDDEFKTFEDFERIFETINDISKECISIPVIVCSNKRINFSSRIKKHFGFLNISSIEEKYMIDILNHQIKRCCTKQYSKKEISKMIPYLNGSPLIARLVAPQIDQYSIEHLIEHSHYLKDINFELSREILSNIEFTPQEVLFLETIAIYGGYLKSKDIHKIVKINPDDTIKIIDRMTSLNIIDFSITNGFYLHPILTDYFERQGVNDIENYGAILESISNYLKEKLIEEMIGTENHVFLFTNYYRILLLQGKFDDAISLKRNLAGEIRRVIIDLYNRNNPILALKYCEIYLEADPDDLEILFFKAKCLTKTNKEEDFKEALKIIDNLLTRRKSTIWLHFKGTIHRWMGNYNKAISIYQSIITENPDHHPSLRDISDCYLRKNDIPNAKTYIERAYKSSPTNPYVLTLYADIKFKEGHIKDSITLLEKSIKIEPKSNVCHKLGILYEKIGKDQNAIDCYKKAILLDSQNTDSRIQLVSIYLDTKQITEAEQELSKIDVTKIGRRILILKTIEVKKLLHKGDLDTASIEIRKLIKRHPDDAVLYGQAAKIELAYYYQDKAKGLTQSASEHLGRADYYINKGLNLESFNVRINEIKKEIKQLKNFE